MPRCAPGWPAGAIPPPKPGGDLVLNGEELALQEARCRRRGAGAVALHAGRRHADHPRRRRRTAARATSRWKPCVRIEPDSNTQLSGLYRSKDGYFTQCEAQGFRRITFYPDRPDVMARFTCTIEADRERFPQLLSNGNLVAAGDAGRQSPLGALGRSLRQALLTCSPWSPRSSTCWKTVSPRHRGARCASRCTSNPASSTSAATPWRR